ncbi:MAG: proline dioxygenase [Comamonadaceae bacterium SCN 68-20]|nr:MAG: proline dioxygenase [Comamonadaceae bacterium SCN 68-20]OJX13780.1 MAG: proline dioxygenase [Burkholderiales bacterium 68-20]
MSTRQPVTPALRAWIAERAAEGLDLPALVDAMCQAGWDAEVARQAAEETLHASTATTAPPEPGPATALPEPALQGAPARIDAGDRTVDVLMALARPRVVLLGNLLSPEECAALIDAARPRMARSLTVATATGGEEVNADRTSEGMFFQRGETALVQRIEARIARLVNWPVENGEGLQVLRYGPGAEYKPHYDYFDPAQRGTATLVRRGGQRVATLVLYLNAPAQGGATTFPDAGLEVTPHPGHAVFFSYARPDPGTQTLHAGAPVLAGEKWIATKWLRERAFH